MKKPVCGFCRDQMAKNMFGRFTCFDCNTIRFFDFIMAPENQCFCGEAVLVPHHKYCHCCGRKNPRFDEFAVMVELKMTLAEVQEQWCFREAHRDMRELDFCSFCGKDFH